MRKALTALVSILIILSCSKYIAAQSESHLRGLTGVVVEVGGNFNDLSKDGLYKYMIQTDIELQLRKAGIAVVQKSNATLTTPRLYAFVDALKIEDDVYVCNLRLELLEDAIVIRDRRRAAVTSWGRFQMVGASVGNLHRVRDRMVDFVDDFANDYLAANPK